MFLRSLKSIFFMLVLLTSSYSKAGIISVDYLALNDGLLTQDTSNNLEWLDVTLFYGVDIDKKTGLIPYFDDGFRLATASELLSLYISAGVDNVVSYENGYEQLHGDSNGNFGNVVSNTGQNNLQSLYDMLGGDFGEWIHGILADEDDDEGHYLARLRADDGVGRHGIVMGDTDPFYAAHVNSNGEDWGIEVTSRGSVGAFMVRETSEVPEPSTLAIFALGVLGLMSRKLKGL